LQYDALMCPLALLELRSERLGPARASRSLQYLLNLAVP